MSNKEILKKLMYREEDREEELNDIPEGYSVNAEMFRRHMADWDSSEEFPYDDLKQYIRFAEWTKKDFSFENEMLIQSKLPGFVHDIFYEVKEFRSNSRNELTSTQNAFARLCGYAMKTQDEKAYCVYDYAYKTFYMDSKLHPETN